MFIAKFYKSFRVESFKMLIKCEEISECTRASGFSPLFSTKFVETSYCVNLHLTLATRTWLATVSPLTTYSIYCHCFEINTKVCLNGKQQSFDAFVLSLFVLLTTGIASKSDNSIGGNYFVL